MFALYKQRIEKSEEEYDKICKLQTEIEACQNVHSQHKMKCELEKMKQEFRLVISFDYQMVKILLTNAFTSNP